MESQVLEQMLELVPTTGQAKRYETIDVYTAGTTALYCIWNSMCDCPAGSEMAGNVGQIPGLPSSPINPVVIPYGNQTGLGGDVHDTFKIDRYDNPYGGHTSIKIPGVELVRVPWEK
ncbi:hypothetical protein CEE44_04060 [Candidatus Woesearchaeota archaeon B3_Woes]|nr:MAG: hypothetical protein CEE44_04060 [Candidatus Woesearchaeota archaeon B3_Woes]